MKVLPVSNQDNVRDLSVDLKDNPVIFFRHEIKEHID